MKLKERPSSRPVLFNESTYKEIEEIVSPPPTIDIDTAYSANKFAEKLVCQFTDKKYSSLRLAIALARYNFVMGSSPGSDQEEVLQKQFNRLIKKEINLSEINNPLPTIGIEVESPYRLKGTRTSNDSGYRTFCSILKFPYNLANTDHTVGPHQNIWEFAPEYSYSAEVQNRILSELIKGRFIPSLLKKQTPEIERDIEKYLWNRLISLHVNLGIPFEVNDSSQNYLKILNDFRILGVSFAIAHTSSLRLRNRQNRAFYEDESGEKTYKSNGIGQRRLEFIALEVRESSVFRLIKEAQIIGGSMFASLKKDGDTQLSLEWLRLKKDLGSLFQEFISESQTTLFSLSDNEKVANILEKYEGMNASFRNIMAKKAREIDLYLDPKKVK